MQHVKNESGSVIVLVTLMIVLLMVMVGLGLDTGQLTYTRNQGQSAVDAAALAAVSALPSRDPNQVSARAVAFNATNDYVASGTDALKSTDVSYVYYNFTTNSVERYNEPIATANGVRVAREGGHGDYNADVLNAAHESLGNEHTGDAERERQRRGDDIN